MQRTVIIVILCVFLSLPSSYSRERGPRTVISVPVSNVVSEPGGSSLETQCVMGEEVMVLESSEGWTRIVALEQPSRKDERGYPGWVYTRNISSCSFSNPVMVVEDIARVYDDPGCNKIRCTLLLGSRVDLIGLDKETANIALPNGTRGCIKKGSVSPNALDHSAESVIEHMQHFLDLGYLWGGTTPYGFDCSGLVYRIGKVHGYDLPRDSKDQALCGTEVEKPQKGDLIFFGSNESITHVALYLGNGEIIHAVGSSGGSKVAISPLKDYSDSMVVCRRVL